MAYLISFFLLFCFPAFGDGDMNSGGIFNKNTLFCDDVGNCYKAKQVIFSGGSVVENGDGTVTVTIGTVTATYLLLEDGTFLLMEDNGKIIL